MNAWRRPFPLAAPVSAWGPRQTGRPKRDRALQAGQGAFFLGGRWRGAPSRRGLTALGGYPQICLSSGTCGTEDETLNFMSTLRNVPPLIRAADVERLGQDPRSLVKLCDKGRLVRVRRGIYVRSEDWKPLDSRTRYGLWAVSLQHSTAHPPVFCHATAALLWGLWITGTPRKLHVITESTSGGRSRNTIVRHRGSLSTGLVRCGAVLVTDKLTTTLALITSLAFPQAVAVCDSSMRAAGGLDQVNVFTAADTGSTAPLDCSWSNDVPQGGALLRSELAGAAELLPSKAATRRALAVIDFSSALSGSAGESISRAHMFELGFPAPILQHRFVLRDGSNAFVDFWFREQRTVGEFDGMGKYLRLDWGRGLPVEQRLLAEKRREDQIRAQGVTFVRWTWEEMLDRTRFQRLLQQAGLPQGQVARIPAPRSAFGDR